MSANPYSSDANMFVASGGGADASNPFEQEAPPVAAGGVQEEVAAVTWDGAGGGWDEAPAAGASTWEQPEAGYGSHGPAAEEYQPPVLQAPGVEEERYDEAAPRMEETTSSHVFRAAEPEPAPRPAQKDYSTASKCSLEYYMRFFDVDTEDVLLRAKAALMLQEARYLKAEDDGGAAPDLYGAVWISTTLWVVLAVCSVLDAQIDYSPPPALANGTANTVTQTVTHTVTESVAMDKDQQPSWLFDFGWTLIGIATVYGYVVLGAAVSWGILRCKDVDRFTLPQLLCLYGYGIIPLLAGALFTLIPSHAVKVVVIVFFSAYSLLTIGHHMWPHTAQFSPAWKGGFFGALTVGHIVSTVLLFWEILVL